MDLVTIIIEEIIKNERVIFGIIVGVIVTTIYNLWKRVRVLEKEKKVIK